MSTTSNRSKAAPTPASIAPCALAITAVVLICAFTGGCQTNASRDWAQTAPVIAPEANGRAIVSLGGTSES